MMMEIWLLATALMFTGVGYFMGKRTGLELGVDGTLSMLERGRYIKLTTQSDGEIVIEKSGE
jgi:hypothetical protein|tara:strand:+ start:1251 stop:1436 length:186 start_codon:yes stop_codon:yes gene_type:complete